IRAVEPWWRWIVMPRFRGRAHVFAPAKLTDETKTDLFAAQLSHGTQEVQEVLTWFGVSTFAGSSTLLPLPSQVTHSMLSPFPEVQGVKLVKVAEFLFSLAHYFGWRVESQLAFCPTAPPPGGAAGSAGQLRVFASLRWAWFTKASWSLERRG